jgi:hypothetical protein
MAKQQSNLGWLVPLFVIVLGVAGFFAWRFFMHGH